MTGLSNEQLRTVEKHLDNFIEDSGLDPADVKAGLLEIIQQCQVAIDNIDSGTPSGG